MRKKTTVKLDAALFERAKRIAAQAGYSSVEEMIEHAIEKELAHYEAPDSNGVTHKLKGLGYID